MKEDSANTSAAQNQRGLPCLSTDMQQCFKTVQSTKRERESSIPHYVGLSLHVTDRQNGAIVTFRALGMSVSYGRVMDVRRGFAQTVPKRWAEDGVVVPTKAKRKLFVTNAVDNLDESGHFEFHGTVVTLTSDVSHDNMGEDPPSLCLYDPEETTIQLPGDYAVVPCIDEYAGDITLSSVGQANLC